MEKRTIKKKNTNSDIKKHPPQVWFLAPGLVHGRNVLKVSESMPGKPEKLPLFSDSLFG